MLDSIWSALRGIATSYILFVVIGVVVGLTVAPVAYDAATGSDGTVAIVPIDGSITGTTATEYTSMLQQARDNSDIKAVVLVSNSGGGSASASETMYLQTKRTSEQMPVVASIDAAAASGAYYTIAPADTVYAKPSSIVGSVGVLATLPQDLEPNDLVGTTGPNKLNGGDTREFFSILESLRRAFINAVYESRGDRIELSRAELAQGQIYAGGQAVQNGLADEIGDRQTAVAEAADQAELDSYDVRVLRPDNRVARFVSRNNYLGSDAPNKEMVDFDYFTSDSGGPTFLMMPGSYVSTDRQVTAATEVAGTTEDAESASLRAAPVSSPERRTATTTHAGDAGVAGDDVRPSMRGPVAAVGARR